MKKILLKIKDIILAEREIICISNGSIKSKKIGCIFLAWNILLVLWTSFATVKYFELREQVAMKEDKITELNFDKQKLLSNIVLLERDINNIKRFIFSLNRYDRFAGIEDKILRNGYEDNNNVGLVLDRVKTNVKNINFALIDRINGLEKVKSDIKFNDNIKPVAFEEEANYTNYNDIYEDVLDSIVLKKTLDENINHLSNLENFVNSMPFSQPIESNYVSSHFGKRLDPFVKTPREHHGVDLVGSYMAKVYAPAPGKVIFVGEKGGYGKTIIIEHKHNVKTVYGHLDSYNVKVGDEVTRGSPIGVQGNTGRSTGHHLHYEILRGRERYNPLEFVKIGSNFY